MEVGDKVEFWSDTGEKLSGTLVEFDEYLMTIDVDGKKYVRGYI